MAQHHMNLDQQPFDLIKSGAKKIESRLYDEKRKQVHVGDTIAFVSRSTGESLQKTVTEMSVFKTFPELFAAFPPSDFGVARVEELLSIYTYYTHDEEAHWGVVGIHLG